MKDDDDFERAMDGLGVKPARPARAGKRGDAPPTVVEDMDFEAAMRELPDGRPGKAPTVASPAAAPSPAPASPTPRASTSASTRAARYEATPDEKAAFLAAVGAVADPKEKAARASAPLPAFDVDGLVRRMRRGQVEPDASLDLHGKTRQQALDQVKRFVDEARAEKWRVVRVVVGRGLHSEGGDAVVGPAVEQWLGDGPALAVVRAPPHLGGAGALLAVLRLE